MSRFHIQSFPTNTEIQPSEVGKFWAGTSVGCAERAVRSGS